jgi:hypothetical protein
MDIGQLLAALDLDPKTFGDGPLVARSPIDGSVTARLRPHDAAGVDAAIGRAQAAFATWRRSRRLGAASSSGFSARSSARRRTPSPSS